LQEASAARGRGIRLPEDLPDPLRPTDGSRPDIGALPYGGDAPRFGRRGRITVPLTSELR
jgi:hypothetical protein